MDRREGAPRAKGGERGSIKSAALSRPAEACAAAYVRCIMKQQAWKAEKLFCLFKS